MDKIRLVYRPRIDQLRMFILPPDIQEKMNELILERVEYDRLTEAASHMTCTKCGERPPFVSHGMIHKVCIYCAYEGIMNMLLDLGDDSEEENQE